MPTEIEILKDYFQKYRNNRIGMMTDIKKHRDVLDKIIFEGISDSDSLNIARTACCILAADLCAEDAVMNDKTGKLKDILRQPDVVEDFFDFGVDFD